LPFISKILPPTALGGGAGRLAPKALLAPNGENLDGIPTGGLDPIGGLLNGIGLCGNIIY